MSSQENVFVGVQPLFDSKESDCSDWIVKSVITRGRFGKILDACCSTTQDCSYVMKIFQAKNETDIEMEIKAQKMAHEIGIAPKIVFSGKKGNSTGIMIMEKMDFSLYQLLMARPS
jgi:hypothetical protein